tara:strand:- start:94 stop:609 length:516 start_codon:yes stop_codon:yes gene_type:complete
MDISVTGLSKRSDESIAHRDLVLSGEAKIKETKRTTTYDLGYATIRSWHKKSMPNYRADVTIKDMPTNADGSSAGMRFISHLINTENNKLPLFINVDRSQFDNCDREKWTSTLSSRILKNKNNEHYITYAVNCYDRTTFMIEPTNSADLSHMFMFADQLRKIREQTLEVLC